MNNVHASHQRYRQGIQLLKFSLAYIKSKEVICFKWAVNNPFFLFLSSIKLIQIRLYKQLWPHCKNSSCQGHQWPSHVKYNGWFSVLFLNFKTYFYFKLLSNIFLKVNMSYASLFMFLVLFLSEVYLLSPTDVNQRNCSEGQFGVIPFDWVWYRYHIVVIGESIISILKILIDISLSIWSKPLSLSFFLRGVVILIITITYLQ